MKEERPLPPVPPVRNVPIDQKLTEEATELISRRQFRPALAKVDQALAVEATSAPALFLKGYCYFSLTEYETALEVLHKALASDDHGGDDYSGCCAGPHIAGTTTPMRCFGGGHVRVIVGFFRIGGNRH